ncbi:MAG: RidA family protein [Rhodospirillales bacterium]|nr:RidA family protein [Rhodospirillales bacterium]
MPLRLLQPPGWKRPRGYANGMTGTGRMVFVAGQVGWDGEERFADGLVAQVAQALRNITAVLAEAGAVPADLARVTWYVKDMPAFRAASAPVGEAWREIMGRHYPAMTVVGVRDFIDDGALVEIEATAMVEREPA